MRRPWPAAPQKTNEREPDLVSSNEMLALQNNLNTIWGHLKSWQRDENVNEYCFINKQHGQCMHNVRVRRVRVNTVAVEKSKYSIPRVCLHSCLLSKMQSASVVLYCHLWTVWLYHISPHSQKRHDFRWEKKLLNTTVCFDFLYNFCRKHSSFCEELSRILSQIYIRLHAKCPLFMSHFKET